MKRKIIYILTFLFCFGLIGFSADLNMEQSKIMIENGNKALMEKDIESAKMYMRRAIQLNPYNVEAWDKYDELMKIISKNEPIKWDKIIVKGEDSKQEEDPFAGFN
ncbi:hypothetical protein DSN97_01820 [Deferribacteraceae bacterium V6Fe1]|nr:hypothetical protein DSN97_01820 [Deferribacteraceae bacterium V6Fe1]